MAEKRKTKSTAKSKAAKPAAKSSTGLSALGKTLSPDKGWKALLAGDNLRFIVGMLLLIAALFMLISMVSHFFTGAAEQSAIENGSDFEPENYGGKLGAYTAYYFMNHLFGAGALLLPVFMALVSVKLMKVYRVRLWKWFLNCGFLMVWLSVTLSLLQETQILGNDLPRDTLGGGHGRNVLEFLHNAVGMFTTVAVIIAAAICYFIYLSGETIKYLRQLMQPHKMIKQGWSRWGWRRKDKAAKETDEEADEEMPVYRTDDLEEENEEETGTHKDEFAIKLDFANDEVGEDQHTGVTLEDHTATESDKTTFEVESGAEEEAATASTVPSEPYNPRLDLEHYQFPTTDLLDTHGDSGTAIDMKEQNANKDRIISVLKNFGVDIVSIKATIGPTISLYEITPAPGVKISKIRNLEDDIAMNLAALGIRIIAPIPGKGTIGIEVPNKNPRIVSMESIINTRAFQDTTYELPIALGKTITNEVFIRDLTKMPHLLVAGATGQGKSVGLNAIITSLLYKKHPSELKLVMVDPKKVEFSVYAPIEKHFLAMIPGEDDPIITDVTKVVQTLKSLCQLMDHRYDLLKRAKVRNIKEYNAKFKARQLNPENGHEFMPYIVVIIDEFGDLIMTAGKEVELPIARLAQLARAVGMHLIIATQRPTTNIITGTIKANFPARMAFKVTSRIDSQTILDRTGANQLVGKGDMLILSYSSPDPVRVQCAFVDTPEVDKISEYIAEQQGYLTPYELPEPLAEGDGAGGGEDLDAGTIDPLFEEAARLVVVHQSGSTSLIQRKFSIGYNRAGRLMDQLERAGIVGPGRGAKPREVLCPDEVALDARLETLH